MSFSIIIPSRNFTNLRACVEAIDELDPGHRIIVVDDGLKTSGYRADSTDHAGGACLDGTTIVQGEKPFSFSRNINIGIRAAGDDDVILLNDDALLKTVGGFKALSLKGQSGNYGVVSSATNNVGNLRQFHRESTGEIREEPRMVCFICVFIPRSTLDTVGLLDERFGSGGFEDDDFCLRTRKAGLKIGIFDDCFVNHAELVSTFRGPGGAGYEKRGAEIFFEKWGAGNHDI